MRWPSKGGAQQQQNSNHDDVYKGISNRKWRLLLPLSGHNHGRVSLVCGFARTVRWDFSAAVPWGHAHPPNLGIFEWTAFISEWAGRSRNRVLGNAAQEAGSGCESRAAGGGWREYQRRSRVRPPPPRPPQLPRRSAQDGAPGPPPDWCIG
eukprot:503588-Prorocentrum_minimum.AAC.4